MNMTFSARSPSARSATPTQLAGGGNTDLDIEMLRGYVPVIRRKLSAGQYAYRAGQAFHALFMVHVGFLKCCELADDGREQVSGFPMRGDLVGVESIGLGNYSCDVIALEDSELWELPYPAVLLACMQVSGLQTKLTSALAGEIRRDRSWMLALGTLNAEQRVAAFLLDIAQRHAGLGFSPRHFILRMGRADMGSYLALKHETVTRALSHLVDLRYISVQRREVRVLNVEGLRTLAGRSDLLQ